MFFMFCSILLKPVRKEGDEENCTIGYIVDM